MASGDTLAGVTDAAEPRLEAPSGGPADGASIKAVGSSSAWPRRIAGAVLSNELATVLCLGLLAAFLLFWRLQEPGKYIYDEVYHSFTANLMTQNDPKVYEWWQSAQPNPIEGVQYEWTHPPLAKLIIAAGIKLFGNNSLGWRFFSAVWGLGSVLLLYLLARQIFRDRWIALLAGFFIAIEGLMFAEARIGTNDIFQLGFLLAAYNCFVAFLRRPARRGIPWLFATGLLLGLGFASKWPTVFSIGFLGAIAAVRAFLPERRRALVPAAPSEPEDGIEPDALQPAASELSALGTQHSAPAEASALPSQPPALGTRHSALGPSRWHPAGRLAYLVATFVSMGLLPVGLYVLSYLQMFLQKHEIPREYAEVGPLHIGPLTLGPHTLGPGSWWDMFVGEQWQMWHYHTTLRDNHPYYSKWWQWLLDIRPVFYYVNRENGIVANTYALGNPLIYWAFPLAIVGAAMLIWRLRQPWLLFVLGGFLINWLPWSRSPRGLFFYHFLPSIPFLVMLLAFCVVWLWRRPEARLSRAARAYVAVAAVGFAFFYTQMAAWPVPEWYAAAHYWLPSWE